MGHPVIRKTSEITRAQLGRLGQRVYPTEVCATPGRGVTEVVVLPGVVVVAWPTPDDGLKVIAKSAKCTVGARLDNANTQLSSVFVCVDVLEQYDL